MGVAGGVERMYHARQFPVLSVPGTTFLAWYSERRNTVNFRALPGWKASSLTSVPGQYQFMFAYGDGVSSEKTIVSNEISFDISADGRAIRVKE